SQLAILPQYQGIRVIRISSKSKNKAVKEKKKPALVVSIQVIVQITSRKSKKKILPVAPS
ncbi:32334_t:CDS:1, partial [Racocetra persica]